MNRLRGLLTSSTVVLLTTNRFELIGTTASSLTDSLDVDHRELRFAMTEEPEMDSKVTPTDLSRLLILQLGQNALETTDLIEEAMVEAEATGEITTVEVITAVVVATPT